VRVQFAGTAITLDFGDRVQEVFPGTDATLTNLETGESIWVMISSPAFTTQLDGTRRFIGTGPAIFGRFHPVTLEPGIWLLHGRFVVVHDSPPPTPPISAEFVGTSRNLCKELA
jgi:hypothetical protein